MCVHANAKADSAGLVLGARVPILTSRADSVRSRLASSAAAVSLCGRAPLDSRSAGGVTKFMDAIPTAPGEIGRSHAALRLELAREH